MDTEAVTLFFALLGVACQALVVMLVVVGVGGRWSATLGRARAAVRDALGGRVGLGLAFAIATTAMLGSLYLSQVAGFTPCFLCWLQRICMYPLALLLGIATVRADPGIKVYAVPLAAIGACISSYHVLVERFPQLESTACDPQNPCSLIWFEHLGFLTIPALALSAFIAVIAILVTIPRTDAERLP